MNIRLLRRKMDFPKLQGWWRSKVFLLLLVLCMLTFVWDLYKLRVEENRPDLLFCYCLKGSGLPELDESEPEPGRAIYFHETTCQEDTSDIHLKVRQSCSVESALRAHSDAAVFLLICSPVTKPLKETENIFVRQLLSYPNFKIRHITVSEYLSGTPLSEIYKSGALRNSLWPVQHASDVLRYATLYKFGGVYLDLDVLVLKPLLELKDFVGAELNSTLGSGILGFSFDKPGREVAKDCVNELAGTFDGQSWGVNGPGLITRVMERRCKNPNPSLTISDCDGFRVFPPEYFQAISYLTPELLFHSADEKTLKKLQNSYTIHFWNQITSKYVLENRTDVPYLMYARKHCPLTYEAAKGNFN